MPSILDNTFSGRTILHTCGGTILSGSDHVYCDRCGAVAYYGEGLTAEDEDDAMEAISDLEEGESNI